MRRRRGELATPERAWGANVLGASSRGITPLPMSFGVLLHAMGHARYQRLLSPGWAGPVVAEILGDGVGKGGMSAVFIGRVLPPKMFPVTP